MRLRIGRYARRCTGGAPSAAAYGRHTSSAWPVVAYRSLSRYSPARTAAPLAYGGAAAGSIAAAGRKRKLVVATARVRMLLAAGR